MSNKIDGVPRELLERCIRANDESQPSQLYADLIALLEAPVGESLSVQLPTKHEISVLVWNVWVKANGIPGVSGFNAAEFAVEAVIEKIKELNQ